MPVARECLADPTPLELVFVDDNCTDAERNGHKVLSFERFCEIACSERRIVIAIGNPMVREALAKKCSEHEIGFFDIRSGHSVVMDEVVLGEGYVLKPFTTLTSNIVIGRHFHANMFSSVSHDCMIGDFVTFAPGVRCNGSVTIGDRAYIGSGAIIRQGLTIGADAVIGMGAVVTRDVPAGATVVGNPAKPLIKG